MTTPGNSNTPNSIPLWQRPLAGPALISALFITLLAWTWQRLADVLVDFGVQLYVPWQLAEGKVLYRDIAHYTGPLSVYYNAMAFRIFGVNLRVLELANLPILIGIIFLIYRLATRMANRFCAVVCCISFLILFAFAHISVAGNYNFVTPYEYEYTHATLLCLACILFLQRTVARGRGIDSAIAGLLAGMVFLTRSEFFVAILAAAVVAFVLFLKSSGRSAVKLALAFLAAGTAPPLLSVLLLKLAMPWSLAIHGTLGMWPALVRGNVSSQYFYLHSMGLDDLPHSLRELRTRTAAWCIPVAAFAGWAARPKAARTVPALTIAFLLGAIFVGWDWHRVDWGSMFRPLPLVVVAVLAISIIQFWRGQISVESASLPAIFAAFSLVLLVKVFLYTRIIHYGCWLAMPATMLLIIALFHWIPAALTRHRGSAAAFIAGVGGVWAAVLVVHLAITGLKMKPLTVSVGSGSDQFWADAPRGNCVNNAVLAAEQIAPDKTIVCVPEGIIINYLARRRTATPYVNFNPPDLLLFGEDNMIAAMNQSPPDFLFLVHKDTSEFGERFFGHDYARNLNAWIEARYVEETLPSLDLGAEPFRDYHFGIRLMVPRPAADSGPRLIYLPPAGVIGGSLAADSTSTTE
jgi:4-amino-4-deoxy-L-arabinose transferase-like glycosyltransferase